MTAKQAYSAFAGLSPISPADKAAPAAAAPHLFEKMPDSWVMHLWRNEPRLFVLSGICKVLWSTCLLGIMSYLHTISDAALGLNNQTKDTQKALKLCFGLIPLMMVYSVANLGKEYLSNEMASKTKARLAALIAQHCVLRASADASERAIALSLASSETNQVCEGALNIHQLWGSMLEFVAINLWFLVNGAVPVKYGVIATGMCLLALSWVAWISILMKRARSSVASLESKQTAAFVEYIANVRTFRLNGWDAFVQRKLDRMTDEMRPLRLRAIRLKMLNIMTSFTLSPVICVVVAIWSGAVNGKLSSSLARSIFDVFDLNKYPMLALPNAARACSNAAAAYERITDYLKRPAHVDMRLTLPSQPGVIELQQLPVGPKTVLPHWRVEAGSLWVLLGPVGSYKSSILDILAGHGNVADGASVRIGGTMSFAPQVAWIQQATIKSNIVCSEVWDQSRYQAVLHACALEHDLKSMPMRDETIVAEKGLNLSGGQRQRLALARAVYRQADIYLLDNPVSAIDDQTQEHIWKHLIEGLLRDSTVVVASSRPVISCTAILHLSPEGLQRDAEIVDGWCSAAHSGEGLPHRYSKCKSSSNAQEPHSSVSAADSLSLPPPRELATMSRSRGLSSAFVENAVCDVSEDVTEYETYAAKSTWKCAVEPHSRQSVAELRPDSRLDDDKRSFLLRSSSDASFSVLGDDARTHPGSFLQHLKNKASQRSMANSFSGASLLGDGDALVVKIGAEAPHDSISSSRFGIFQFLDACQPRCSLVLLAILYPAYQLLRVYIGFWSGFWQRASFGLNNNQFQVIFGGFALALMVVRLLNDYVVYKTIALPGITRVRKAFSDAICNAPMSFFMTENLGKIATVYSRDIVALSESFVDALHFAIVYVFVIIAVFLRMMYEIPFSAIPLIPACVIGVCILLQYAKKIRTTKIEFQEADDNVFRAMCNAIEGVKVIRTADATDWALEQMAAAFRNWRVATVANDRVAFWLFARMEPLAHILALTTCILSTQLETGKSSGVSLSLEGVARRNMNKQALSFLVFLPIAVKRLSLVYAGMTSVEKVFKYIQDVPREARNGIPLEESWPSTGELELKNLCLKYSPTLPNALNNVNLKLAHGSKVGICGRTGCGKSSLFVALFRLVQPHHGDMLVAGRNILNVDVDSLRRRMSIIPQDPVMFGGTLRENIDPLALYADAQVQEAIALLGFEGEKANLDRVVKTSGEGWSLGERQLVCLARVIVRKPQILFMDEATAALDQQTEARFQRVLETHFASTTIVCVAHRLENLRWCRTRVRMDEGGVLTVDSLR